jgi:hypothetical protein
MFENVFSRRNNLVKPPEPGNPGELRESERIKLWNLFYEAVVLANRNDELERLGMEGNSPRLQRFLSDLWTDYFVRFIDSYMGDEEFLGMLKAQFLGGPTHVPLDILEIANKTGSLTGNLGRFQNQIEDGLRSENSFYQLFEGQFIPRLPPEQRESLEAALSKSELIRIHFTDALRMLSDRQNPDYRNSIKESISAVESACQKLTGLDNATLTQALNKLHATRPLHVDFRDALQRLYWWTSDDSGMRHALSEAPTVTFADAQFMLVTCSAFVNYLLTR